MIYLDNLVFSLQHHGGVSVLWGEVIKQLQKSGFEYRCLEYPGSEANKVRQAIDIPSNRIDYREARLLRLEQYSRPRLKGCGRAVYHTPIYRDCVAKGVVNVVTLHDFTYNYFACGLRKWVHNYPIYRAIRNADYIICITENTKRDLMRFLPGINERNISVIYNGASDDYCVIPDRDFALQEYVVYVGGRQFYKNFNLAVEAVAATRYKLLVAGGALIPQETALLNKALGQERWRSVVHPFNKELNRIYNSVHCLLYPSSYEGFGIPVIEAQKAGCPVVAFRASSIPEIIGDTPLMFDSPSAEAISSKLEMLESTALRDEVIANGLENGRKYSWKKMAQEYIELYDKILMGGGKYLIFRYISCSAGSAPSERRVAA